MTRASSGLALHGNPAQKQGTEKSPTHGRGAQRRISLAYASRSVLPFACASGFLLVAMFLPTRTSAAQDLTPEQVNRAIDNGVKFLKDQQNVRGAWREHPGEPCGLSALCTLALLECGVPKDDPVVKKALEYLRGFTTPRRTYSTSLQTMALCSADPERDAPLIRKNVAWLQNSQISSDGSRGAWSYGAKGGGGDRSNTQFALLALHEAERVGIRTDRSDQTWRLARQYWLDSQQVDGSWCYFDGTASTGSMTCAGIASLVITSGHVSRGDARVSGGDVICCGEKEDIDEIERGLAWLADHFTVEFNPTGGGAGWQELREAWHFYYLYGLERVGRLTGKRFIGKDHDWYREGAGYLVRKQDTLAVNGRWAGRSRIETEPLIATSFALLFLAKGRRPIVVSKLAFDDNSNWNQHRRDVAHLTRFVERQWRRKLTWQTIDIRKAGVEDLLQSPVIFISGTRSLPLAAEQKKALKEYVERGGFIFAEACDGNGCDGEAFDRAFRSLMQELFPENPLRPLPASHPVWFAELEAPAKYQEPLYGIDACCRTSVVYCPKTLSCWWELAELERGEGPELAGPIQEEMNAKLAIGANVLAYATGRELRDKLDAVNLDQNAGLSVLTRGALHLAKLDHNGGADEAPAALNNLLRTLAGQIDIRVAPQREILDPTDDRLSQYPIVFMHGRRRFRFNDEQRQALRGYLQRGGFLFADAICASPAFADAFREEMAKTLPESPLTRLPADADVFTDEYGGFNLKTLTVRDPQARATGDRLTASLRSAPPWLEGAKVDDRYAVLFSPYDMSCALENASSLECTGYIKTDAGKLGVNILLYALQQ